MYKIPEGLTDDILNFSTLISDFEQGTIDEEKFKIARVPMGVYEQRKDGTYMVRIRTTGGIISPDQLLKVIEIGQNYKSNLLHITTRQEIQLQNLEIKAVESILKELQAIELSSKGGGGNTVRNILVSVDSGISESDVFDVTPHAIALTTKLIAEPDSFTMPRKLKIAFSAGEATTDYAAVNDIGFVAKIKDGKQGFKVYIGGSVASKPTLGWVLFDFVPAEEMYVIVESVKQLFSEHGDRKNRHKARLRYIFYRLGEEEVFRLFNEYYNKAKKNTPLFVFEPLVQNNDISYTAIYKNTDTDKFESWKKRYVHEQKQKGFYSVLIPFIHGNIWLNDSLTIDIVNRLLNLISQIGDDVIRFSTQQNIHLRHIPTSVLYDIYYLIKDLVTDIHQPVLINNIVSCTGADTCRLGIGLSKGLAAAIREELLQSRLDLDKLNTFHIHISGCPNSCGQQIWADLGFSGRVLSNDRKYPAYQVYAGALRGDTLQMAEVQGALAAKDIPQFVVKIFAHYLNVLDRYGSFRAYFDGEGKEHIAVLLDEYKQIPSFEENPDYYSDWGKETLFSTAERSAGECFVGPFDLIAMDISFIKESKKTLEAETNRQKINNLLYDIVYSSSRMLLITKSKEAKTTKETFDLFLTHFINAGLIDQSFAPIVELVREGKDPDLIPLKEDVFRLSEAVIALYGTLDNSLQFKK